MIFEDDPYRHIRFAGEDIPTMLEMDSDDNVVYASSFSKTVCPGIRVGYLVGPQPLIAQIQKLATNTYISPSMVSQAIVHEFCVSGALESRSRRSARRSRTASSSSSLSSPSRSQTRCSRPRGRLLHVGGAARRASTSTRCSSPRSERGVAFVKGSDFLLEGGHNTLRLAYSGVTLNQIDEGIQRLADAYNSVTGAPAPA